jgi:Ni/Co efflux regulator RcnB
MNIQQFNSERRHIMFTRPRIITIVLLSIFTLTSILIPNTASARQKEKGRNDPPFHEEIKEKKANKKQSQKKHKQIKKQKKQKKKHVISPRYIRKGHVVKRLPRGYRRTWYGNTPYYYNRGAFYRPSHSGFVVVGAPSGSIIVSLPIGYRRVWVNNSMYYSYGGNFYQKARSGYTVVSPPETVVVQEEAPVIVQPPESAAGEVTVTTEILNVRSGPGLKHPIIHQIHEGYILEVQGKTVGWLYVQLPNGEYGWVMNIYTTLLEPDGKG